jgi:hypothetical protein
MKSNTYNPPSALELVEYFNIKSKSDNHPIPLGRNITDDFLDTNLKKYYMEYYYEERLNISMKLFEKLRMNDNRIGIDDQIAPSLKSKRISDW